MKNKVRSLPFFTLLKNVIGNLPALADHKDSKNEE